MLKLLNSINAELGVASVEEALAGARDIIAEIVNENADTRTAMRKYFQQHGVFKSTVINGKEEEGIKYKDYFNWEEPVKSAPSHRVLAMRRAENESVLKLEVMPPEDGAIDLLEKQFLKGHNESAQQVKLAIQDGYKRLLAPAMSTSCGLLPKKRQMKRPLKCLLKMQDNCCLQHQWDKRT